MQNSYLRFMWNKEPEMRRSEWTWGGCKLVAMIRMYSNPDYDEKLLNLPAGICPTCKTK